jgi:hypothetical protein
MQRHPTMRQNGNFTTLDPHSGSDTCQHSNTQMKSSRQGHQHKQMVAPEGKVWGLSAKSSNDQISHVPTSTSVFMDTNMMQASDVPRPSVASGPKVELKLDSRKTYSRFLRSE